MSHEQHAPAACCHAPRKSAVNALKPYWPLIAALGLSLVLALAVTGTVAGMGFMNAAMAFFLIFLGFLQMLDLKGYARAFAQYDLVAAKLPAYGLAYPFIEVALGLAYLTGFAPVATNTAMAVIMAVGLVGVARAMRSGRDIDCACAGSAFKLPVGWVTVAENGIMGLMALANLAILLSWFAPA